jgi:hypothetical protein
MMRVLKKHIYAITTIAMLSLLPISFADSGTYELEVDGKTFDITYNLDGQVIAVEADQESTSLLVGITNANDSIFEIGFSSEVLSAINGEFIVLVDGLEADYAISYNGNDPTITFPIEAGSEEVEIIGTSVIPEFPFGAIAAMGIVSTIVLIISRTKSVFR